jgi:hypothetical protein
MKGAREPSLTPEWELYDLKKDPAEMNNVYGDPRYKRVIKKLKMEILKQRHDLGDEDNNRPVMKEIMNEYFWK